MLVGSATLVFPSMAWGGVGFGSYPRRPFPCATAFVGAPEGHGDIDLSAGELGGALKGLFRQYEIERVDSPDAADLRILFTIDHRAPPVDAQGRLAAPEMMAISATLGATSGPPVALPGEEVMIAAMRSPAAIGPAAGWKALNGGVATKIVGTFPEFMYRHGAGRRLRIEPPGARVTIGQEPSTTVPEAGLVVRCRPEGEKLALRAELDGYEPSTKVITAGFDATPELLRLQRSDAGPAPSATTAPLPVRSEDAGPPDAGSSSSSGGVDAGARPPRSSSSIGGDILSIGLTALAGGAVLLRRLDRLRGWVALVIGFCLGTFLCFASAEAMRGAGAWTFLGATLAAVLAAVLARPVAVVLGPPPVAKRMGPVTEAGAPSKPARRERSTFWVVASLVALLLGVPFWYGVVIGFGERRATPVEPTFDGGVSTARTSNAPAPPPMDGQEVTAPEALVVLTPDPSRTCTFSFPENTCPSVTSPLHTTSPAADLVLCGYPPQWSSRNRTRGFVIGVESGDRGIIPSSLLYEVRVGQTPTEQCNGELVKTIVHRPPVESKVVVLEIDPQVSSAADDFRVCVVAQARPGSASGGGSPPASKVSGWIHVRRTCRPLKEVEPPKD